MVSFDNLPLSTSTVIFRGTDFATVRANYERPGLRARESITHSLYLIIIETVCNKNSNAPFDNGGFLGEVVLLRKWFTGLPMIFPPGFVGDGTANVRGHFLSKPKVDTIENLRVRFIYSGVIAVIELE